MARENHGYELAEIENTPESEDGIQLEEIVWEIARELHHITSHEEGDLDECDNCRDLATSNHIDLSRLKIRHEAPEFKGKFEPEKPSTIVLFESSYRNKTGKKQMFSFKTKKVTTSAATVELTRPLLYGSEGCKVELELPKDICPEKSVFGTKLNVTKSAEDFTEELEWSVDNLIDCPPKKITKASLVVTEHKYASSFTVTTKISGKVIIVLTEENHDKPRYLEHDIVEVIRKYQEKTGLDMFNIEAKRVAYVTKGKCQFSYGIEQQVNVETKTGDGCCTVL